MNPIAVDAVKWTRKKLSAASIRYLKGLPEKLEIEHKGRRIVAVHGSPAKPLTEYVFPWVADEVFEGFLRETKADILILGHTHIPFVKKLDGRLVVNPGSVG